MEIPAGEPVLNSKYRIIVAHQLTSEIKYIEMKFETVMRKEALLETRSRIPL